MKVPFNDLNRIHEPLMPEFRQAFERVVSNNAYILGKEVEEFEQNFAEECTARYAAGVSSGTDALELILRAHEIGRGEEVITQPNSFIATANAIRFAGATPVFVDCAEDYLIDVDKIENAITTETKAIMPVHLYGQPADMMKVHNLALKYNLYVIEDACQAHGASHLSEAAGVLGDAAAFSFYPGKNLGAFGDAGIVTSDNKDLIEKVKMLRNYGQSEKYHHDTEGFNKRLDALQAAILNIKLPYLNEWNLERKKIAEKYSTSLDDIVTVPSENLDTHHAYHLYVIRTEKRDELAEHLKEKGVDSGLHYPIPIHLQPSMKDLGYKPGDFPNAEKYSDEILSLPIFPKMNDKEVAHVIKSVKSFFS